jgi:hypothetical protein
MTSAPRELGATVKEVAAGNVGDVVDVADALPLRKILFLRPGIGHIVEDVRQRLVLGERDVIDLGKQVVPGRQRFAHLDPHLLHRTARVRADTSR